LSTDFGVVFVYNIGGVVHLVYRDGVVYRDPEAASDFAGYRQRLASWLVAADSSAQPTQVRANLAERVVLSCLLVISTAVANFPNSKILLGYLVG